MCAIFGSCDTEEFIKLADLNSYRGQHSFSITQFTKDFKIISLRKENGPFDKNFIRSDETFYLLGHIQAPTTQSSDIHPCEKDNKKLWHNGIIKQFVLDKFNFKGWDTEFLLDNIDKLSDINGSFACILYAENSLYIFRNEISPLFIDTNFNLSSTRFENCFEVLPNKIFKIEYEEKFGFTSRIINTFSTLENPYFFYETNND